MTSPLDTPQHREAVQRTLQVAAPRTAAFDRSTRLASALLNAPFSVLALLDHDNHYVLSTFGIPDDHTHVLNELPLCRNVVTTNEPLAVADLHSDPRNSSDFEEYGVASYLGVPLHNHEGTPLGTLCVVDTKQRTWGREDLTALQDLAAQLVAELRLRHDVASHQQAVHEQNDLLCSVAHDLKNPLTTISGALELILSKDDMQPSLRAEMLSMALRQSHRMQRMAHDLVTAANLSSQLDPNNVADVDPGDVLDEITAAKAHTEDSRRLHVHNETAGSITTEPELLVRILSNLVDNSLRHAGREATVTLRARQSGDQVQFTVTDDGSGIAPQDLHQLFKPFKRGATEANGSGLGLFIVKQLTEVLGGTVHATSQLDQGSTFTVILPVSGPPAAA